MASNGNAAANNTDHPLAASPVNPEQKAARPIATTATGDPRAATWSQHDYYNEYRRLFSPAEAQAVIELSKTLERQESRLSSGSGRPLRDCSVFWIHRGHGADWALDRIASMVHAWNEAYGFEIAADQPTAAQLTLYRASQEYSWHMDLGAGPSSLRKVSVVVGLNDPSHYTGGGTEIFYGGGESPTLRLGAGDAICFPPYVMHRAVPVETGERWTLALWFLGDRPFR